MGKPTLDFIDLNSEVSRAGPAISPLKLGVSMLAVCTLMIAAPAYAQQAEAEENADAIIVTGIRKSLASAQTIKKDSDTIVDAITAEDIGALPDRSVTEALQRVPGIAINRFAGSNDPDHFSVEGSGVTIRGLNFVRSEFNGRSAFVAGVGGQALNFSDVPSELLGSVIVSKNATADLIEGGLSGSVNLNTRKPFGKRGFQVAFGAEANYGDFRKKWTPNLSGLISNTWDTEAGTFGLLASASYSRIKSRSDGLQVTNFQTRDGRAVTELFQGGRQICRNALPGNTNTTTLPSSSALCGAPSTPGADGFADPASLLYAPVGAQFRTQEYDRKRDGFSVAAQFESIDKKTTLTAEFIRSHTKLNWDEYTYEAGPDLSEYTTYPFGCLQNANGPRRQNVGDPASAPTGDPTSRAECPTGFTNFLYDDRGLFQQGYIVNTNNGWRGNPGTQQFVPIGGIQHTQARREVEDETTNQDWSLNLKTQLTDRLLVELDGQYATSRKKNLDVTIHGSNFADQELDLRGNLPNATLRKPTFLSYNWATPGAALAGASEEQYFSDPRFQFWRSAMDHIEDSEGTQYAFKGDATYDFGEESFLRRAKVGARYSNRDQTVRYTTYNWGVLSEVWGGDRTINFADTPADAISSYAFPNFFRGQTTAPPAANYYNGDLINDYAGFASFAQGVNARWKAIGGNNGWVPLASRNGVTAGTPYLPNDVQPITQEEASAYAMLSFGSDDFAGIRMSGNVGLRYVNSSISSTGQIGVGTTQALGIQDPFSVRCAATVPVGAPAGTPASVPGGVCLRGPAGYAALQAFADGSTSFDVAKNSYSHWLPSFNVKFSLTDDLIVRGAASKVLTRPDNALLRNYLSVGLDGSGNLVAGAGNPFLKPVTAWQYDLTAEWYFARVGSLTLNGFYKAIDGIFYSAVTSRDITNNGRTETVQVNGPANFPGTAGKIKGFELAYQQTYDFLPGFLSGLGVQANYTYIDSKGIPNSFLASANQSTVAASATLPLEQLSKHNVNAAVFYEKGPISIRAAYTWRSKFLLTVQDVIAPFFPIFNAPTGQMDASVFFNLSDNVKVGVQGVNLLNETTRTLQDYSGNPAALAPRSFFTNDRRFSFILRGNF